MTSVTAEVNSAHRPSEHTLAVQQAIRETAEMQQAVRIMGAGTWLDAGRPVAAHGTLEMRNHAGVVEYVPGDLTMTVRAGTTLREIHDVTAREQQWFPINPAGWNSGTIGATVATASYGPLAHRFGTIRDLILGIGFVAGDGRVVRGGGRVVKNVAGFDLVRLLTGSWGTLGVITEVTLRLYALPQAITTVGIPTVDSSAHLARTIAAIMDLPVTAFAVEVVNGGIAESMGLPRCSTVLVQLGGSSQAVAAQSESLLQLHGARELDSGIWDQLRTADEGAAAVARLSAPPARMPEMWEHIAGRSGDIQMHATVSRGVIRCIARTGNAIEHLLKLGSQAAVLAEKLPAEVWEQVPPLATDRISRGIKAVFDARNLLNPGLLTGMA